MAAKKRMGSVVYYVFVTLFGLLMIYPMVWLVMSSFKNNSEIFVNTYSLIPKKWDVATNYSEAMQGVGGTPLIQILLNSIIVAGVGTIGGVLFSSLAAYAFARVNFKGKNFWFMCVMGTLMIPNQVMVVPQYIIFQKLGMINHLSALIAPWFFGNAFFIFLTVQFIRGLPIELDEAAEIDGCGKMETFFRIILPLIRPAIITSGIFSFYWIWQDFFQPLIFMSDASSYTVSLALNACLDPTSYSNYGALFAMSVIAIIPVIIVFLFFQKYLVEGIATTGLKD